MTARLKSRACLLMIRRGSRTICKPLRQSFGQVHKKEGGARLNARKCRLYIYLKRSVSVQGHPIAMPSPGPKRGCDGVCSQQRKDHERCTRILFPSPPDVQTQRSSSRGRARRGCFEGTLDIPLIRCSSWLARARVVERATEAPPQVPGLACFSGAQHHHMTGSVRTPSLY
jgi:hypothetical protein